MTSQEEKRGIVEGKVDLSMVACRKEKGENIKED